MGDVRQIRDLIDKHPHRIVLQSPGARELAAKLVRCDDVVGVELKRDDGAIVVETRLPDRFYGAAGRAGPGSRHADRGSLFRRRQPGSRLQVPGESMTTIAPTPSPSPDPEPGPSRSAGRSRGILPAAVGDRTDPGSRHPIATGPIRLSNRVTLSAILTVVRITVARQGRGIRLLILAVLFSLPIVVAVLIRRFQVPYRPDPVEGALIFGLIFQALLPVSALLFASGMVQDDIEEQTLTYFLIRPIPRWAIYLAKLLGTFVVTAMRAVVFTIATLVAVYWGEDRLVRPVLTERAPIIVALMALSLSAYVAIFGGPEPLGPPDPGRRRDLHRGLRGGHRQHRLRHPGGDGDVPHPGPGRAMARRARRRLVDRPVDRPRGLDLPDRAPDRQRASSRPSVPSPSACASSASRRRRGAEWDRSDHSKNRLTATAKPGRISGTVSSSSDLRVSVGRSEKKRMAVRDSSSSTTTVVTPAFRYSADLGDDLRPSIARRTDLDDELGHFRAIIPRQRSLRESGVAVECDVRASNRVGIVLGDHARVVAQDMTEVMVIADSAVADRPSEHRSGHDVDWVEALARSFPGRAPRDDPGRVVGRTPRRS